MQEIIKVLWFFMLPMSIGGLLFLFLKQKGIAITLVSIILFSSSWRLFSKNESSRYYSLFIYYGISLSAYMAYVLVKLSKRFRQPKRIISCLFLGLFIIHVVKCYSGFRNNYFFDLEETNCGILSDDSSDVLLYEKKLKRIKEENPSRKMYEISNDYNEISRFLLDYPFIDGNILLLTSSVYNSLDKKNPLTIRSTENIFSVIQSHNSNHEHTKHIYVLKMMNYSSDLKLYNDIVLSSPGHINITKDMILSQDHIQSFDRGFFAKGKKTQLFSKIKILARDCNLSSSVKVKNIGNSELTVYVGYLPFSYNGIRLDSRNYPFSSEDQLLTVVSTGTNTITVNLYPKWKKGCMIAYNAKNNFEDIPNNTLLKGKILEVKKKADSLTDIVLDQNLDYDLAEGSQIRVHGTGGTFIYSCIKTLQPDEEQFLNSPCPIILNEDSVVYSSIALPRGTYYVTPLIFSYSSRVHENNTLFIRDYNLSF